MSVVSDFLDCGYLGRLAEELVGVMGKAPSGFRGTHFVFPPSDSL